MAVAHNSPRATGFIAENPVLTCPSQWRDETGMVERSLFRGEMFNSFNNLQGYVRPLSSCKCEDDRTIAD